MRAPVSIRAQVLKFDDLLLEFYRTNYLSDELRSRLESVLFFSADQKDPPLCTSPEFVRALGNAIFYHVSNEPDEKRAEQLLAIVAEVVKITGARIGDFEGIDFKRITGVDRAYWIGRQNRFEHHVGLPRPTYEFHLTRINGLPFAEGVYGELMAVDAADANTRVDDMIIDTVPIPWQRVGAGLKNGFIDVAIHNETIVPFLERHLQAENLGLFRSSELFSYHNYPLVHNERTKGQKSKYIAVPKETDFEKVYHEAERDSSRYTPEPLSLRISDLEPDWVESSDIALEKLANAECGFALVGAVHAGFAERRFPNIKRYGFLDSSGGGTAVHAYVLGRDVDKAREALHTLVEAWNSVANTILRFTSYTSASLPKGVLERLNSRAKQVFVDDEQDLKKLIRKHNLLKDKVEREVFQYRARAWQLV